jgi:hypothetical protein
MGGATRIGYSDNCIVLRPVFQLWEWPVLDSDIVRAVKDNCPERVCHLRCSGMANECRCGERTETQSPRKLGHHGLGLGGTHPSMLVTQAFRLSGVGE